MSAIVHPALNGLGNLAKMVVGLGRKLSRDFKSCTARNMTAEKGAGL